MTVRRAVLKSGLVAWPPGMGAGALPPCEGLDRPLSSTRIGGWGRLDGRRGSFFARLHIARRGGARSGWHLLQGIT